MGGRPTPTRRARPGFRVLRLRGAEVSTYERALGTARKLEGLDVVWLEEPLPRYDDEHGAPLAICDFGTASSKYSLHGRPGDHLLGQLCQHVQIPPPKRGRYVLLTTPGL